MHGVRGPAVNWFSRTSHLAFNEFIVTITSLRVIPAYAAFLNVLFTVLHCLPCELQYTTPFRVPLFNPSICTIISMLMTHEFSSLVIRLLLTRALLMPTYRTLYNRYLLG